MVGDTTWNPLGAVIELMESGAVPVSATASVTSAIWPTATVPKLSEVGLIAMAGMGAGAPVPLSGTVKLGLAGSLLEITSVPVVRAAVVVTKRTITLVELPGATLNGAAGEVTVNPDEVVSEVTVRSPPLVLLTVTSMSFGWLKMTVPKLSDRGSTAIDGLAGAAPVPLRLTDAGEFGSSLAMVSVALAAPAADGANRTVTV